MCTFPPDVARARVPGRGDGIGDRGSAAVVLVAVVAVVVLVISAVLAAAGHRSGAARARGAADAAALAAAAAAIGLVADEPCAAAGRLARADDVVLITCEIDGSVAHVEVSAGSGPAAARAVATAGPGPGSAVAGRRAGRVPAFQPSAADWLRLHRPSPPECVWCACRPAGHRIPGRPGRFHDVRRPISTIDQGDTCQARRSS
ncbi:Rv3654c family TadE-like protein [Curtobacterium salicis]|uniref:Rv3654c family TadE-like protein n=1 Tax=Curtobacterium salicis TaxID=1779862 RepID=UPI00141B6A91